MQPKLILVAALGLALGVGVAAAVWTLRGGASAGSTAGRGAGQLTAGAGAAAADASSTGGAASAPGPAGTTTATGADPNAAPGSAIGLPTSPGNHEGAKDAPPGADGSQGAGEGEVDGEGDASTEGEPQLRFSADKEGIQGAVRDARPKLKECYEGWLKADGKLGGTLKLTFTIAPPKPGESPEGGDPIAVIREVGIIHSELGNMAMEGCALNAMSGLQFDAPEAEVVVNYPLVFEADSADDAAGEAPADEP